MRIGFYNAYAGTLHAGGVAVYLQQMAAELSKRHEVYLYTQDGDTSELLERSDVTVVESPSFDDRLLDAVHYNTPLTSQDAATIAMTLWGMRNGIPTHIDEHTDLVISFTWIDDLFVSNLVDVPTVYGFHSVQTAGFGGWLRHTLSDSDAVLANSHDTARKVEDAFDRSVDDVIYPGVDIDRFHPEAEPAFESDDPAVLYVGRLFENKGIFDLLEAVSRLGRPVDLHVAGYGKTADVERRARDLGIEERVILHGEVPHLELPGYYAAADVCCLPSYSESFGMVNVEAMACGTPVVTSDLEAIRRYLTDWKHGLLVEPGDPDDVAEKLEAVLGSETIRREMGECARERAGQFAWEEQAKHFEQFCADLLDIERSDPDRERPTQTV